MYKFTIFFYQVLETSSDLKECQRCGPLLESELENYQTASYLSISGPGLGMPGLSWRSSFSDDRKQNGNIILL